jgi:hypothetical protein
MFCSLLFLKVRLPHLWDSRFGLKSRHQMNILTIILDIHRLFATVYNPWYNQSETCVHIDRKRRDCCQRISDPANSVTNRFQGSPMNSGLFVSKNWIPPLNGIYSGRRHCAPLGNEHLCQKRVRGPPLRDSEREDHEPAFIIRFSSLMPFPYFCN